MENVRRYRGKDLKLRRRRVNRFNACYQIAVHLLDEIEPCLPLEKCEAKDKAGVRVFIHDFLDYYNDGCNKGYSFRILDIATGKLVGYRPQEAKNVRWFPDSPIDLEVAAEVAAIDAEIKEKEKKPIPVEAESYPQQETGIYRFPRRAVL